LEYSNPDIPEGINVSPQHPLREFFLLTIGVITVIVIVLAAFALAGERVAALIPFATEQSLVEHYTLPNPDDDEIRAYLDHIGERLVSIMDLPEGMTVSIHYVDGNIVNAYASLGGNIIIYRGLLQRLPSENALAMVLAHEIAHVRERHPVMSLGRGLGVSLALSVLIGAGANDLVAQVLGESGLLTLLTFSRHQERAADRLALHAVASMYGHVSGAEDLFQQLLEQEHGAPFEFLRSHPLNQARIDTLRRRAEEHAWSSVQTPRALPEHIARALATR